MWACQLKEELHDLGSDMEPLPESLAGDAGESDVAPHPQARLIVHQKLEHKQLLGPGGVAAGHSAVTEFTTFTPYIPAELQELGKQCRQRPREPIPT